MPTWKPIEPNNHRFEFISAFIAPIAAKHGGVKRLNTRYAKAATLVMPMIDEISPAPETTFKASTSMKLVMPNTTAKVPTTFSFAMNPVMAAAASCQRPKPKGIKMKASGVATLDRMLVASAPSATN